MKYLMCLIALLSTQIKAQEETPNDQKRPSWSQGLPERQKAPTPTQPSLNVKMTDEKLKAPAIQKVTTERPKFELERLDTPQFEYQIQPESTVVEFETTDQPIRLDSLSKTRNRINNEKQDNPLHNEYSWKVLNTTPIEMPNGINRHSNINVNIFIKPDGSVSKVTSNDPNVSSQVLRYAAASIENWQFEAPEKIGISDVMSKTFAIEIKP